MTHPSHLGRCGHWRHGGHGPHGCVGLPTLSGRTHPGQVNARRTSSRYGVDTRQECFTSGQTAKQQYGATKTRASKAAAAWRRPTATHMRVMPTTASVGVSRRQGRDSGRRWATPMAEKNACRSGSSPEGAC